MLGESHQLLLEFPEHVAKIAELRASNEVFHHLMDEYDWLDSHIQSLEEVNIPVSDFHIEEMKKRRLHLKDKLYRLITS
jgi:uncharacterized protein YdcH (DUF465 family)